MRRKNDAYFSSTELTLQLLNRVSFLDSAKQENTILECCAGNGAIASVLRAKNYETYTSDIDRQYDCDYYGDATDPKEWEIWKDAGYCHSAITNPPFDVAHLILPLAYEASTIGVAFLLRLSYLEPAKNRAEWLEAHENNMSNLIVFGQPRPSFTDNGKTDTCTTAWMVWKKDWKHGCQNRFVPRWKNKKEK